MEPQTNGDNLLKGLVELIRTEGHEEDLYIRPLAFYSDEIIGVRLHDLTAEVSIVAMPLDRKSTRLNSSHVKISYAVFCLKKKRKHYTIPHIEMQSHIVGNN